jgi:hypothetical protein
MEHIGFLKFRTTRISALGQEVFTGKHKNGKVLTISAPAQRGTYFLALKNKLTNQYGLCKVLVK